MIKTALETIVGVTGESTDAITKMLTDNVLGEVVGLLPVLVPVVIGFIAFRKGYKFLKGSLRSA